MTFFNRHKNNHGFPALLIPALFLPVLLLLLVLSPLSAQQPRGADYRIGPQDQLEVTVMGLPEIEKKLVRVTEDGKISLPLIGEVTVNDMTSTEVERELARILEVSHLRNPQVTVFIKEFASKLVTVVGAVTNPQAYPLLGRQRILNIISRAGGLTPEAGDEIVVIRETPDGSSSSIRIPIAALFEEGDTSYNIPLEPNDIISVPKDKLVNIYVMGEVRQPKVLEVKKSQIPTLLQAVTMAGGFTERARKRAVIIQWIDEAGDQHQRRVNVNDIIKGKTKDVRLKENDVVIVKQSLF